MIEFDVQTEGGNSVIRVDGALDFDGIKAFKTKISDTRKDGAMTILVNFEKVTRVQSAHLQEMVPPIRALSAIGGTIAFCGMNDGIHKMLKTSMFYPLIKVFDTEEEAVGELFT